MSVYIDKTSYFSLLPDTQPTPHHHFRWKVVPFVFVLSILFAKSSSQNNVPNILVFQSFIQREFLKRSDCWNVLDKPWKEIYETQSLSSEAQKYVICSVPPNNSHISKLRVLQAIDLMIPHLKDDQQPQITAHVSLKVGRIPESHYIASIEDAMKDRHIHPSQLKIFLLAKNDLWPLDIARVQSPELYSREWLQKIHDLLNQEVQRVVNYQSCQIIEYYLVYHTLMFHRLQLQASYFGILQKIRTVFIPDGSQGQEWTYHGVDISWDRIELIWSSFNSEEYPVLLSDELDDREEVSLRMILIHSVETNQWKAIKMSFSVIPAQHANFRCLVALVAAIKLNDKRSIRTLLELYNRHVVRMNVVYEIAVLFVAVLLGRVNTAQWLVQELSCSSRFSLREVISSFATQFLLREMLQAVCAGHTGATTLVHIITGSSLPHSSSRQEHDLLCSNFDALMGIMMQLI